MKGGGEKTVTNQLDPQTQKMREEIFNRARSVSNQQYIPYTGEGVAGPNSSSNDALAATARMGGTYDDIRRFLSGNLMPGQAPNITPYTQAGAAGASALGGDQNAIAQLMNPYINQVVDSTRGQFDQMRNQAALGANDAATRAGAFGGDRAALMKGARLGEIDRAQGQTIAGLLSSGYDNAMGRAGAAAGLGLNAQDLMSRYGLGAGQLKLGQAGAMTNAANSQAGLYGQQFGMGDQMRLINQARDDYARNQFNESRDWGVRGLDILKGGMSGLPYGSTQSEPLTRNAFAGAAGGALTGAQLGGPWGAAIGGLGGLLFG